MGFLSTKGHSFNQNLKLFSKGLRFPWDGGGGGGGHVQHTDSSSHCLLAISGKSKVHTDSAIHCMCAEGIDLLFSPEGVWGLGTERAKLLSLSYSCVCVCVCVCMCVCARACVVCLLAYSMFMYTHVCFYFQWLDVVV